jgi:hypothetical protein
MLIAVTLIGILGVVPQSKATNGLLVFFSCIFSKSLSCIALVTVLIVISRRVAVLWVHRMGFRRGNFFSATQTLHRWIRRCDLLCRRSHHECVGAVYAQ